MDKHTSPKKGDNMPVRVYRYQDSFQRRQAYDKAKLETQQSNYTIMIERHKTEITDKARRERLNYEQSKEALADKHVEEWNNYNRAVSEQERINEDKIVKSS